MQMRKLKLSALLASCVIALSGCVSSPQVGRAVVAPQVKAPEPPTIVRETLPQPPGYYQRKILDALQQP